jgi:hypothetical protein
LEQLKQMPHTEELISELADSNTPIYYGEIISEWQSMPSEYDDRWQETEVGPGRQIMQLMQIDLALYYYEQFLEVWEEVKSEHAIPEA